MTTTGSDEQGRAERAEARTRKTQQQERERELAKIETAAALKATDDKIARLKALRLEKERSDAAELAARPPEPVKKTRVRKKVATAS